MKGKKEQENRRNKGKKEIFLSREEKEKMREERKEERKVGRI